MSSDPDQLILDYDGTDNVINDDSSSIASQEVIIIMGHIISMIFCLCVLLISIFIILCV